MLDSAALAAWTGGVWHGHPPAGGFDGTAIDTRTLRRGQLFVALRGDRRDGHDFLAAAREAGAAGALVETPQPAAALPQLVVPSSLRAFQAIAREWRRCFRGPVIGVTGSAGKTSTKELIALLLGPDAAATAGNLNNHLGVPLTLTALDPERHKFAVVEAGISARGEMAVLADMIRPDVAVVTLVGPAHLAELGGLEEVAAEKAALAARVADGGRAIFPRSCLDYAAFRNLRTPTLPLDYVLRPRGESVDILLGGAGGTFETFTVPVPSEGMAQNAALALRVALHLRVSSALLRSRLAQWKPAKQRGEVHREGGRLVYVDSYNANPVSMLDALAAFERLAPVGAPRLFVLGCMEELGPEAPRYHRELGAALRLGPADRVVVIGGWAEEVKAGAAGAAGQIEPAVSAAAVAPLVAEFAGSVFLKGSRRHRVEEAMLAPC